MLSLALIATVILFSLYILRHIKTYLELRDFGGYKSVGWTRLWLLRCHLDGKMHTEFTEINNKYGMLTPSAETVSELQARPVAACSFSRSRPGPDSSDWLS